MEQKHYPRTSYGFPANDAQRRLYDEINRTPCGELHDDGTGTVADHELDKAVFDFHSGPGDGHCDQSDGF